MASGRMGGTTRWLPLWRGHACPDTPERFGPDTGCPDAFSRKKSATAENRALRGRGGQGVHPRPSAGDAAHGFAVACTPGGSRLRGLFGVSLG